MQNRAIDIFLPSKVGRPRTTTKIKISYDDGAAASGGSGKRKGPAQLESRTAQTADAAEAAAAAAAANRSLEETWQRRESGIILQIRSK